MKTGPDITLIAALIGDPARANILTALLSGKALTALELSHEAGVTPQTTSSHLKKLSEGGLIAPRKQGRHRYFSLASAEVAQVLESLMGLAAGSGLTRTRTGPRDADLREARVCYNHLAGPRSVQLYDGFVARDFLRVAGDGLELTASGAAFVESFGLDLDALRRKRSPLCRSCLDWSERRTHLAGSLGRALLFRMEQLGWVNRVTGTRILRFSAQGEAGFSRWFVP